MFAENLPKFGEPTGHSDSTVMVTVQDLINCAMGPPEGNKVNFKLIQTVLHILARQMRIQEQYVDFGLEESQSNIMMAKEKEKSDMEKHMEKIPEENEKAGDHTRMENKERANIKEREIKAKEKLALNLSKITDKEAKYKSQPKAKEKDIEEKEMSKLENMTEKEGVEDKSEPEAKEQDKEKTEKAELATMTNKENSKYESQQKIKGRDIKEKEKAKLDEITNKEAEYESQPKAKEQDIKENEKSKLEKMTEKEEVDDKSEPGAKKQDKETTKKTELATMTDKEKSKYESQKKIKERYIEEKEKAKLEEMTDKEAEYESQPKAKEQDIEEKEMSKLEKMTEKEGVDDKSEPGAEEQDKEKTETAELATMTDKEKPKYESQQKIKERDIQEKEKAKLEDMTDKESEYESQPKAIDQDIEDQEKSKLYRITEEKAEDKSQPKAKEQDIEEKEKSKFAKKTKLEKMTKKEGVEDKNEPVPKEQDKEKTEKAELATMTDKENSKYESQQRIKERDIEENEKAKLEELTQKEAEYESQPKAKEQDIEEREKSKLEKITEKREEDQPKAKGQDVEEKEEAKLAKITHKERSEYENDKKNKPGIFVKDSRLRVGSMEVVTRSEFKLLEEKVKSLEEKAAPVPYPLLPDNSKLRKEISAGSVTLTSSMQALQMMARVQAAEEAVGRMTDILTMLVADNEVSKDVAGKVKSATDGIGGAYGELTGLETVLKSREASIVVDSKNFQTSSQTCNSSDLQRYLTSSKVQQVSQIGLTIAQELSMVAAAADKPTEKGEQTIPVKLSRDFVTRDDLDNAVGFLKNGMIIKCTEITSKTRKAANAAINKVQNLVDLTHSLTGLGTRIINLQLLVEDYGKKLAGLDLDGVNAQLGSYSAHLESMRSELRSSNVIFQQFDKEPDVIMHLKSRYDELVAHLDLTNWTHKKLTVYHNELCDEHRQLKESVEKLKEDKVDVEMLSDGLRDKANRSELTGLMSMKDYDISRSWLERDLKRVQDKFDQQDHAWMHALQELNNAAVLKSDIKMLLTHKAYFQDELMKIQHGLNMVSKAVDGPKAALLARQLSQGGYCGVCTINAVQDTEGNWGLPTRLPAASRRRIPPSEVTCEQKGPPPPPPSQTKTQHFCHRWVGGSHTLLSDSVVHAEPLPVTTIQCASKKYTGYGNDGKLYRMEEKLTPCSECAHSCDTEIVVDGTGDTVLNKASGNVRT